MNSKDIAKLLVHSENLTEIPRTGYVLEGVVGAEKVSSHCFGVVFLSMLIADEIEDADTEKALRIAIIHDLPESQIGDLTPSASKYIDKNSAELKASQSVLSHSPYYHELFQEYQKSETIESKIVHDADKLQMLARASRYKRQGKGDMSRFSDVEFYFQISFQILNHFKLLDGTG